MKTEQSKWLNIFLITIISLIIISCSKDDDKKDEEGQEVTTAYVREVFSYTPNGNITYLEVVQDLSTNADLSKAVELGQNVSVLSGGEHPFTINSTSKTITKWNVNKENLKLSVASIFSYASTGVTSTDVVFVSETAAYISDLSEGKIVEFNPTTMEITKTHNVPLITRPTNFGAYTIGNLYKGKIIFPIQWLANVCCDYSTPLKATIGIFDPATGILTYDTDDRTIGLTPKVFIDGDNAYLVPANGQNDIIKYHYGALPKSHIVLKLNNDGTINDNYTKDLSVGLPNITYFRASTFISQNKYYFTYSDSEFPKSFSDRYNHNVMKFQSVSYDLISDETNSFAFDDKYTLAYLSATIDSVNYFRGIYSAGDTYNTDIFVQNGEDFEVISSIAAGSFGYIGKLW